ncbi:MAG TPA: hypothetical protein PLN85_00705 [archaeon]|jgi:hypothetical protein|nr:hypothetical protein [archaeon]
MEWKVNFEKYSDRRILVKFNPIEKNLTFIGQYKINNNWIDFYNDVFLLNININQIANIMYKIHEKLNELIDIYEKLSLELENFKTIDFVE